MTGLPSRAEGTCSQPGLAEGRPNTSPLVSPYLDLLKHPTWACPAVLGCGMLDLGLCVPRPEEPDSTKQTLALELGDPI